MVKGVEAKAKEINPNAKVTVADSAYDLVKQTNQIDNFVAAGVDLILLSAANSKSITPAIKRAQAAGIVVVAVDVVATGADAAVLTNNAQAGELACQYLVDKLGADGGQIVIQSRAANLGGDRPGERLQESPWPATRRSRSCRTIRTASAPAREA